MPSRRPSTTPDHPESGPAGQAAKKAAEEAVADTAAEVQAAVDKGTEQGFVGVEVDTTPNENYTVAGVISGAPTPETEHPLERAQRDGVIRGA